MDSDDDQEPEPAWGGWLMVAAASLIGAMFYVWTLVH
jgi:hypothetical protein